MSEYFTEAKTVEEGEALSSYKHNALAHAINSRLRSCIGDGPWRIAWYMYSLFRHMCHSDDYEVGGVNDLFPWDAFFRWFQHVGPDQPVPEEPPGAVGGLITNNLRPMSAFIIGNGQMGPEDERLNPCTPAFEGDTPTQMWSRFKSQRGYWVDGDALDLTRTPALEAGQWIDDIENAIDRPINHSESGYGAWHNTIGVPSLQKTRGRTLSRTANAFVREFRGSDAQRNDTEEWPAGYHVQEAANWTDVMTTQFLAAPQYAAPGTTTGEYATWEVTGTSLPAGTTLPQIVGGVPYSTPAGFLTSHGIVRATNLSAPATVRLTHAGGSFDVSLEDDAGLIFKFPEIAAYSGITITLPNGAELTAPGGDIHVEINAIAEMKPQVRDLYTIARLSGAMDATPDGRGVTEVWSRRFAESYLAYGGIVNQHDTPGVPTNPDGVANQNAFYEASREMSKFVRILPGFSWTNRNNFLAMERVKISDDPLEYRNSIWMMREDQDVIDGGDAFAGVAPIVPEAAAAGWSNEWMIGVQLKPYTNSDSSVYKPEGFPSMLAFLDRATFGLPLNVADPKVLEYYKHLCASSGAVGTLATKTENPTVFRYATRNPDGSSSDGYFNQEAVQNQDENFLKSCRIYEPDLEITHIEEFASEELVLVDEAGVELVTDLDDNLATEVAPGQVRLDLSGRWHSTHGETDGAPDEFPWDQHYRYEDYWQGLRIENDTLYRTTENGLRSFLFFAWSVDNPVNGQQLTQEPTTGDGAYGNAIYQSGGGPNRGCTMPHFYMTKLMPLVHADGNEDPEWGTDTHFVHDSMLQADLYLRVMCEGFLRGLKGDPCADRPTLAEYTYEQLISDATDGELFSIPTLPDETTDRMSEKWVRENPPWGAGPIPYTYHDARRFNIYVNAVNLLRSARIPWPGDLLPEDASGVTDVANDIPTLSDHGVYSQFPMYNSAGATPPGVTDEVLDWGPVSDSLPWTFYAAHSTRLRHPSEQGPDATDYGVYSNYRNLRWRVENVDLFYLALPPALKAMVDQGQVGLPARVTDENYYTAFENVTGTGESPDPGWTMPDGTEYRLYTDYLVQEVNSYCSVVSTAMYQPDPPPPSPSGSPSPPPGSVGPVSYGLGRDTGTPSPSGDAGPVKLVTVEIDNLQSLVITPGILQPLPEEPEP